MPLFPDSPSSPSVYKLAITIFGSFWILYGLTMGYQGIILQKITRRSIVLAEGSEAIKQGFGWLCLAFIVGYLVVRAFKWVDNSEY